MQFMRPKAIYIGSHRDFLSKISSQSKLHDFVSECSLSSYLDSNDSYELVVYDIDENETAATEKVSLISKKLAEGTVLFVIAGQENCAQLIQAGADDVFTHETPVDDIELRFDFIKKHHRILKKKWEECLSDYKIPLWKRIFDICFATLALLCLSPLFILIVVLIRLESKGKVFYSAKRVGQGYRVFNFYKFRSMYVNADKNVSALMNENQYADADVKKQAVVHQEASSKTYLYSDDEVFLEHHFLDSKRKKQDTSFFKVSNDPRITKVGRFIRNTSIDELPQLVNILIGDMSVVGNRPLPLYEAEMLTTDRWAKRFLAPAGLTGLWQVTKRGGANKMSADERKQLDIVYAETFNFWLDLKIIFKTLPAMLQQENV